MSFKLPVIASNTGGLPEIVVDGRSGILVPVGGSIEVCAAVQRLLDDKDLRRGMGESGYCRIIKRHQIEETAHKYVDVLVERADQSSKAGDWPREPRKRVRYRSV